MSVVQNNPPSRSITGIAIYSGDWIPPGCFFSSVYFSDYPIDIEINTPAQNGLSLPNDEQFFHSQLIAKALEDAGYKTKNDLNDSYQVIDLNFYQTNDLLEKLDSKDYRRSPLVLTGGDARFWAAIVLEDDCEKAIPKRRYAKLLKFALSKDWVEQVIESGSEWVIAPVNPSSGNTLMGTDQMACALDVETEANPNNFSRGFFQNFLKIILGLYYSALLAHDKDGVKEVVHPYFYINKNSKSWLRSLDCKKRIACQVWGSPASRVVFQLEEADHPQEISVLDQIKARSMPRLVLSVGNHLSQLEERLKEIKTNIQNGDSLDSLVNREYDNYLQNHKSPFVLSLIANSNAELEREAAFALKGVKTAFEKNGEWQSPSGSYFTSTPLGENSPIAFVYPGAFNSYTWMAKDLFFLFPQLYEKFSLVSPDVAGAIQERLVYPRLQKEPPGDKFDEFDAQLMSAPIAMLTSGTALSYIFTSLLNDIFSVFPHISFGYSLGETSMMFGSGVWSDGTSVRKKLELSPLFRTKLAGPLTTIKEFWRRRGLPLKDSETNQWANYVLMCEPEQVIERLNRFEQVYLTHINTSRQVVIGGDPEQCRNLINEIHCTHLLAPFSYALHCEPIQSEYRSFVDLFNWNVAEIPTQVLYSAASYSPIQFDSKYIAAAISRTLCNRLDFPKLIQKVYQDGARCFIELGAGSNCARWIDDTLKGVPHLSLSINRKGLDDYSSILRLIGRLVSNRLKVNLSVLFTRKGYK